MWYEGSRGIAGEEMHTVRGLKGKGHMACWDMSQGKESVELGECGGKVQSVLGWQGGDTRKGHVG